MVKNPNTNCLAGYACPKCGSFGPFSIECTATFDVSDDGTDNPREVGWSAKSKASCHECKFTAKLVSFDQHTKKEKA